MQPRLNTILLGILTISSVIIAIALVGLMLKSKRYEAVRYENSIILVDVIDGKTILYRNEENKDKHYPISVTEDFD